MTFSKANGGAYSTYNINEDNGVITASIPIAGNWGQDTVTGTITLNVFVT